MFTEDYFLTNTKSCTAHVLLAFSCSRIFVVQEDVIYSKYFHKNDPTRTDANHLPKDHRPFRWLPGVGALQTDKQRI